MESTFNQRFKTILKYYDLTPTDAARKIGITRQIVDGYLRDVLPRIDTVALILKAFPEVDINWLVLNDGSMLKESFMFTEPDKDFRKLTDLDIIKDYWKSDREELIKLRDINRKLTEELISIRRDNSQSKAVG